MSHQKIDAFNHIFPKPFFDRLQEVTVNKGAIKRWLHIPFLHDVEVRFRLLEEFGPEYRQILSLSAPPIESINPDRQITLDLASLANDSQAELVRKYPDRFPGFIASLPLNHPDESAADEDYAGLRHAMPKRPIDYFRMFWADTAVFGSRAATECGLSFFGPDRVVFASDAPFDPEGGPMYIRETIRVIDGLAISEADRRKLYRGNADRLFNLTFCER